jgi:hypothetical protein
VLGELLEAGDLDLALASHRIAVGELRDQALNPISDLKGEMGGGRARERPDVFDRHRSDEPIGVLGFAHFFFPF